MRNRLLTAYGLLLLIAIGSYALLGWHVRMLADDYCTAATALRRSVVESVIHDYYSWNWTYVDSFLKAIIAPMQPAYHQVQTLILLVALLGALWWLVREVGAALALSPLRRFSGLIALLLLLLFVYTAPNAGLFYWHAVIIAYSLPTALIIASAALLIRWSRNGYQRAGRYAVAFMLVVAVLLGTANTFFLPLMGALALGAIYAVWRVPLEKRRAALGVIAAVGATALVAFAVVFTAPGNAVRQAQVLATSGFTTPGIDELILLTFRNAFSYLIFPYFYTIIYALLALCVGAVVTLALGGEDAKRIARFPISRRAWVDALAIAALFAGVALATIVTTSYGVGRLIWHTMFFPRVAQALCMVALGYMLAVWLAQRGFPSAQIKQRPAYRAMRLTLIGLLVALPLGALVNNLSRLPNFQAYAQDWDAVHQMILSEVAAGSRGVIEVPPYRYSLAAFLHLDDIDQPDGFTRLCAASFYGVQDILMPPALEPPRVGFQQGNQP